MLEQKLDLSAFLQSLEGFFARVKSYELQGDKNVFFQYIRELDGIVFTPPERVKNLSTPLLALQKFGVLRLEDIFEFVKILRYFHYLKNHPSIPALPHTSAWLEKIKIPPSLLDLLSVFDEKGGLRNGIFENYDRLKAAVQRQKNQIDSELKRILHTQSLAPFLVDSQIHFIHQKECLLLKAGFQNVIQGVILDRSGSGFFYLLPEAIAKIHAKQNELLNLLEIELYEICKDISLRLNKQLLFLRFINAEFDKLDHIQARIFFAKAYNLSFILPDYRSRHFILRDFYHPILQNAKPIQVDFSKSLLLITGVNAGGKTMLLKSLLASSFLSKHLIPFKINAAHSKIPHFKHIEAIISDPQNSKNDISTFAGRMLSFSQILHQKDMILGIDEIELGTDADEAASLYKVLLQSLLDLGTKVIVTTHHKRLAALMASDSRIQLAAALFDEKAQKPLFEFLYGSIGKSYAFEMALRYHIPPNLINEAKKSYGEDREKLNVLIQNSAKLEIQLKEQLLAAQRQNEELARQIKLLEEERERVKEELKKEKQILQSTYDHALKELRIQVKDIASTHKAIHHANTILSSIQKPSITPPKPKIFQVGDWIKYGSNRGVILGVFEKDKDSQNCLIELESGMRLRIDSAQLKSITKPASQKALKPRFNLPSHTQVHLDLHGLRAEEALFKLDKFLSDSLLAGFDEVLVYHGIGSGILARVVKEFLSTHPRVVSFEDAPPNMGGFGAKLIRL